MKNSIINKSYNWLTARWKMVTTGWNSSSGKHVLLRTALIILSLIYAALAAGFLLAMLPVILIAAVLAGQRIKSAINEQKEPAIINVTPETSQY